MDNKIAIPGPKPRPEFRVIIAGGRDFALPGNNEQRRLLQTTMDNLLQNKKRTHTIVILCGMAKGADLAGKDYGVSRGFKIRYFPAEWDKHGKSAGFRRNAEMAQNRDALVAFWDGKSSGTKHMIETAKAKNLAVRIVQYGNAPPESETDEFGFPIYR